MMLAIDILPIVEIFRTLRIGFLILIEAYGTTEFAKKMFSLVLIGKKLSDEEMYIYKAPMEEYQLADKVLFTGQVQYYHMLQILKNADVRQGKWGCKGIKPKTIADKFMDPIKNPIPADLPDYKFFCFNGEPQYCQVIRNRRSKETIDFYNMDWGYQEFVGLNHNVFIRKEVRLCA